MKRSAYYCCNKIMVILELASESCECNRSEHRVQLLVTDVKRFAEPRHYLPARRGTSPTLDPSEMRLIQARIECEALLRKLPLGAHNNKQVTE